ncbi:MAG: tetratricopeptide repeat protein [Myxococcota bacterium]
MALPSPAARRAALAGLLLVLTAVAYARVVENGFIWDDDVYVYENPNLTSLAGLRRIWLELGATPQYYPLVHTSYWVEHALWGLDPRGYHVVNALLHALGALLLWRVLARLAVPGAWLAAAIFALHPVNVESVAWVTERKNVLSGALYLAALLAYLRSAGFGPDPPDESRANRYYALSLVAFAGALLSKTVTGSLPAVILLLTWWKRGRVGWPDVRQLAPFFALVVAFGPLTLLLEKQLVGAKGWEWDHSALERVLIAGRALWFYAAKLVWPHPLIFNYPRWEIDAGRALSYLYPAAAVALGVGLWAARERIGRAPLVATLVFAGTLFPALGFFDVYPMRYSFVADHFQYLAGAALIALFAAGAVGLARRLFPGTALPPSIAAAALLAVLGILTWRQVPIYRDHETLWRDTLAKNPESWMALDTLGVIHQRRGELDRAISYFRESVRVCPEQPEAYNNLGIALRMGGKLDESIAVLRQALELDPDYHLAQNSIGLALHALGEYELAADHFRRALHVHPAFAAAHTNLGITLAASGRRDDAIEHHRMALQLDPGLAQAHNNLAVLLLREREFGEAIRHLAMVVKLDPDSAEAKQKLRAARRLAARSRKPQPGTESR